MFAKKLLSIVGLLLVGSQVIKGEAVARINVVDGCGSLDLTSSTTCETVADATYYCYKGGYLFALSVENVSSCVKKLDISGAGVKIVKFSAQNIENITGNVGTIADDGDKGKYAIYNCDASSCVRATGYIKDGDDSYFSIGTTQNDKVSLETGCSGNIGLLKTGNELCLDYSSGDITAGVSATGGTYLLTGTANAANPFTGTATSNISIKIGSNYMIKDTLFAYDTTYEYCVDEDKKIQKRSDNWCASDECTYHTCTGGVCTDINARATTTCDPTAPSNCSNGYYLYDSGLATANGDDGTLYLCSSGGSVCKIVGEVDDANHTNTPIPNGYLINADMDNFLTVPFFSCDGSSCEAVSPSEKENCNGLSIGDLIVTTVSKTKTYNVCHVNTADAGITIATVDTTSETPVVNPVDDKKYVISVDYANDNIFGRAANNESNYIYAATSISNGSITTVTDGRYFYTSDSTNEIQERASSDICNVGPPVSPKTGHIKEYKKSESTDFYMDNTANINPTA